MLRVAMALWLGVVFFGVAPAQEADRQPYRRVGDTTLALHTYRPADWAQGDRRVAVVFFFGGGWVGGRPAQFAPQAEHLAGRGMVAYCAEYRVRRRHGTTPHDAVADARAALAWLVEHADEQGVDPTRIVAAGGSAGGHLAACTAFGVPESRRPAALVLFNPVLDTSPAGFGNGRIGADWRRISPQHHLPGSLPPPILVLHGTGDSTVPFAQAERFREACSAAGARCVLRAYAGRGHGFFNPGRGDGRDFPATLRAMERFLGLHGLVDGPPTFGLEPRHAEHPFALLRSGLGASIARIRARGSGRVAFLGGSITFNPGWRDQVAERLRERLPEVELEFVNAGVPSFGSTPGAFRLHRDVLAGGAPDLLLVEAAVNDATNGRSTVEMVRGMEGIVRSVRRAVPDCGIALLHFVDPDKIDDYRAGRIPAAIAAHESVARHYGLPSLDLAEEVAWRIDGGEFEWEQDFGGLHPSPFGQRVYGESIARFLDLAFGVDDALSLPEPLDAAAYVGGRLLPVSAVTERGAFTLVDPWRPDDGARTRPGFVDVPALVGRADGGDPQPLQLDFTGHAVGVLVAAGPDAGVLEWSLDGGAWQRVDLHTRWSGELHLPWSHVLAAGLDDAGHRLRLRPAGRSGASGPVGHAARILHFLVAGGD